MEKVGDSVRMSNRLGEERTRKEKAEARAVVSRGQDSRMCGKEEPLGSCQRVIGVGEIREERNGERMRRREYGRGQGKKVEDKAERQEGENPEKDTCDKRGSRQHPGGSRRNDGERMGWR